MNTNKFFTVVFAILFCCLATRAQVPLNVGIQILKSEDARRYDTTLEDFMRSPNVNIRVRAALAAGRIGNESALPLLHAMLASDESAEARAMAAFAIGEIESIKNTYGLLDPLKSEKVMNVRARIIEAAGKMAAANPTNAITPALKRTILEALENETDREVILAALTAALRARPDGADIAVAEFLPHSDARVRADAANTLARLRAKNANEALRKILAGDTDPIVRANAARALGAAEDKDALDILFKAATEDRDSRVRVAAIRALGSLKDAKAADRLIDHGGKLLSAIQKAHKPTFLPAEQNEFIELAVTLGRILPNSEHKRAEALLEGFAKIDKGHTPEIYIARIRISQARGDGKPKPKLDNWKQYSSLAQTVGEFAVIEPNTDVGKQLKSEAPGLIRPLAQTMLLLDPKEKLTLATPDVLRAFARFKTDDLGETLRKALKNQNVFVRAAAAELIAEMPASKENVDALKSAFSIAFITDKYDNDAQLAILDAAYKLDKKQSVGILLNALTSADYLVRRKAFELLGDKDLQKDFPGIEFSLAEARKKGKDQVIAFRPVAQTKLGQLLNNDADHRRALSRKNGSVRAVLTTTKGIFTINFFPEDAPLTVDNFIKLARSGYFNGLEVHRVVPNFVMQDGDPRGDGNGGPGWSIRCEVNRLRYVRGAVGMALSGKDTGGSQWFVTHSPQPHLDGGYTVFGHVNEIGMKVVDNIVRGDKILSVKIIGR